MCAMHTSLYMGLTLFPPLPKIKGGRRRIGLQKNNTFPYIVKKKETLFANVGYFPWISSALYFTFSIKSIARRGTNSSPRIILTMAFFFSFPSSFRPSSCVKAKVPRHGEEPVPYKAKHDNRRREKQVGIVPNIGINMDIPPNLPRVENDVIKSQSKLFSVMDII